MNRLKVFYDERVVIPWATAVLVICVVAWFTAALINHFSVPRTEEYQCAEGEELMFSPGNKVFCGKFINPDLMKIHPAHKTDKTGKQHAQNTPGAISGPANVFGSEVEALVPPAYIGSKVQQPDRGLHEQPAQSTQGSTRPAQPAQPAQFKIVDARPPIQVAMATEIAREEGFGTPGMLLTRLHNPGGLVWVNQDGSRRACHTPSISWCAYADFSTDQAGWAALHKDLAAKWVQYESRCAPLPKSITHDECIAMTIAWNWPALGNGEAYAFAIHAGLKRRGFFKEVVK